MTPAPTRTHRSLVTALIVGAMLGILTVSAQAALVGHYQFEEGSGTTATDSSGKDYDGTIDGATFDSPGLHAGSDYALDFDRGDEDNVDLGDDRDFLQDVPGATLMAWVQPTESTGTGQGSGRTVIAISGSTESNQARALIQLVPVEGEGGDEDTPDVLRVGGRRLNDNGFQYVAAPEDTALTVGEVYHIAGVIDYTAQTMTAYINGQQVATGDVDFDGGGNSEDATHLGSFIGAKSSGDGEFFPGVIDSARIYNTALSGEDVLAVYQTEIPEPATLALLLLGGVAILARRRPRRRA